MSDYSRTVKHEGEFYPFAYLRNGALCALETSRDYPMGSEYQRVSAVLLGAFAIEAHLNHIGALQLTTWPAIERRLGPEDKLRLIAELLRFQLDLSRRPFQSFRQIFAFRNRLVHGKDEPVSVRFTDTKPPEERVPYSILDPQWLKDLTFEQAAQWLDDVTEMVTQLHAAAGLEEHTLHRIARGESVTSFSGLSPPIPPTPSAGA